MNRPRNERDPSNAITEIGSRHIKILRAIESYGTLDTIHLSLLTGLSMDNIEKPLRQLFDTGLIDKMSNNLYNRNSNTAWQVYNKNQRGFELLERRGLVPLRAMWTMAGGTASHNLKVCLALASIEYAATQAGLRFIPWEEILLDAPEETKALEQPFRFQTDEWDLVPDAMYSLANQEDYRSFSPFELDLSDRANSIYEAKSHHYHELIFRGIYKRHLGMEQRAAVLTATTNQSRFKKMASFAKREDPFYFKVIPQYGPTEGAPAPVLNMLEDWYLPSKQQTFNLKEVI